MSCDAVLLAGVCMRTAQLVRRKTGQNVLSPLRAIRLGTPHAGDGQVVIALVLLARRNIRSGGVGGFGRSASVIFPVDQ